MKPTALLTLPATLVHREPDGEDEYGNPGWAEVEEPVLCELQQETASEALGNAVQIGLWRLFLPASVPGRGWDGIRLAGDGVTYELEGDPWLVRNPRTGETTHVEARCRRVE